MIFPKIIFQRITAIFFGIGLTLSSVKAAAPSIVITNLPPYGASGNLAGLVLNANPATNCVVVFIYVAGAWYTKPGCSAQLTPLQADGSWSANITQNSNDKTATEIAAFLVPTNYNLPCVDGAAGLTIPSSAKAVVYANRLNPSTRQFNFSGYSWSVKTSSGSLAGPGPNYYSDSTNNVWVDARGLLHLKITYTNGAWQCAEVISTRSFGYGQYRFTVTDPANSLDPNVVLGLFTWSNDSAYNDREIDIELSRWSYAFGPSNVEDYAIAPYHDGQVLRFPLPTGLTNSTHSFIWQSNGIAFQSLGGNFSAAPPATNILNSWNYQLATPPPGGEQVRMNLWLNKGSAPTNGQPAEVIISQFEFVPLGPPPPAQLNQLTTLPGGNLQLNVQAALDWRYDIYSSSNLLDWLPIGTVLATNNFFQFTDPGPASASPRFYRVLTEP